MYNLAVCYLYGHGVAPNHTAAFDWLHKARCPGPQAWPSPGPAMFEFKLVSVSSHGPALPWPASLDRLLGGVLAAGPAEPLRGRCGAGQGSRRLAAALAVSSLQAVFTRSRPPHAPPPSRVRVLTLTQTHTPTRPLPPTAPAGAFAPALRPLLRPPPPPSALFSISRPRRPPPAPSHASLRPLLHHSQVPKGARGRVGRGGLGGRRRRGGEGGGVSRRGEGG